MNTSLGSIKIWQAALFFGLVVATVVFINNQVSKKTA